jgi:ribokinase
MAQVVVVGSLSMDLTASATRLPSPGETVIGSSFTMVPGGKGNNQAITCARQGVATAMVGRVGRDVFGDAVRAQLVREGVDVSHLLTDLSVPTGIAHITVDAAGQNSIIIVPLSNHALTVQDVMEAATLIAGASVLLVQLEVQLEVVRAALETAKRTGTTTMLNPAPALELPDELLSMVDICVPNELEAAALTRMRVDDAASAIDAAGALHARGCGAVVVTLGSKGSVYLDKEQALEVPALSVPVVDTVAAGDAFCGAFASALARGSDVEACLVRATATGALAVGVPGATPSLPLAGAVDEALSRFGPVRVKRLSSPIG